MDIPPLTANRPGYRKPIDLSEQLPSYALVLFTFCKSVSYNAFYLYRLISVFSPQTLTNAFRYYDTMQTGWIHIGYEQFLSLVFTLKST